MLLAIMTISAPLALAAPPACEKPATKEDLHAAVTDAGAALRDGNLAVTDANLVLAAMALRCMDEVPSSEDLAKYYHIRGVELHTQSGPEAAAPWIGAARGLNPALKLTDLVPFPARSLSKSWEGAKDLRLTTELLSEPRRGTVYLDGAATRARPTQVPTYFQLEDANGAVVDAALLIPGDLDPEYPARRQLALTSEQKRGRLLLLSGGGTVAVSLLPVALAWATNESVQGDRPPPTLEGCTETGIALEGNSKHDEPCVTARLERRTNLAIGAGGALVVAGLSTAVVGATFRW